MNALTLHVLRALSHAEYRSGEALAQAFGVSRGTIHNALDGLEGLGVRVRRSRGLGYRLHEATCWLDGDRVRNAAGDAAATISLSIEASCESTNTVLLERARAGAASGTVVAAELQTKGRGRRGRSWESALGAAITFSMLWRVERGVSALSGMSLAVGVAIVRALRRLGGKAVLLKWPNDIVLANGKLGGILIEVEGDALGPSVVVIGVGLNVRLSTVLKSRIGQAAVDLADAGIGTLDRNVILGTLLRELCSTLAAFERGGFAGFRPEWQSYHAHQDRAVALLRADGVTETGIARGVNDDGALLLEIAGTLRLCLAGDVSLRA